MSWLNYIRNKHKSSEGYWGCNKQDPEIFRHIIEGVYETYDIKSILEIGFNIGCSASMWLEWDKTQSVTLTAVDICKHSATVPAAQTVQARYGERFRFYGSDSKKAKPLLEGKPFDMAFIDGDHSYEGVVADTLMAIELGATILLYDDWHEKDTKASGSNGVKGATRDLEEEGLIQLEKVYYIEGVPSQVGVFKKCK
jgi:predicted O-methyltransferase YrrM